jgi:transposase
MRKQGRPRKFTEEFRREAVRLASGSERPLKDLAAELGISPPTLRSWMSEVSAEKQAAPARVLTLEEQVRKLQRENERLREEREILKKATAFFAKGAR